MIYTITKYAQSCILIEKDGARCLIDPGRFVKEKDGVQSADWPHIDLILVTHEHADHYDADTMKFLIGRDGCPVLTNGSCAEIMKEDGIDAHVLMPGAHHHETMFHVEGVAQTHGKLDGGRIRPEVVGFKVDNTFYTPGDSVVMPAMPHADIFFVPVAGPEMTLATAREMVETVAPKIAVPIHYSNTAQYPITVDEIKTLEVVGVDLRMLADKESMQWSAG